MNPIIKLLSKWVPVSDNLHRDNKKKTENVQSVAGAKRTIFYHHSQILRMCFAIMRSIIKFYRHVVNFNTMKSIITCANKNAHSSNITR